MKKIIYCFLAAVIVFSLMAIPVYADEISEEDIVVTEAVDEEVDEVVDEEVFTEEDIENAYTFLGRVDEFYDKYNEMVVIVGGDILKFAAAIAIFVWSKLKNKDVKSDLNKIISSTGQVSTSQGNVIGATNNLIDAYNAAAKKIDEVMSIYEKFEEKDSERDLLLTRVLVQNQALLEIIQTAYANSQLPQGTKDLVVYKYAKCLALSDDEEKIASIIGAIHAELTPAIEGEEINAEAEEAQEVEA